MGFRLCYLQAHPTSAGRSALRGRRLYDHLRAASDDWLIGHAIGGQRADFGSRPDDEFDLVTPDDLQSAGTDVILVEGGLFGPFGTRVDLDFAQRFVANGGVLVLADIGCIELTHYKDEYRAISPLMGSAADYGSPETQEPAVIVDDQSNWGGSSQNPLIQTSEMAYASWLAPIYDGVRTLAAARPAVLASREATLASGNAQTSTAIPGGRDPGQASVWSWVYSANPRPTPFAFVAQRKHGFVVVIAAYVTHDTAVAVSDNARWLENVARELTAEAGRERLRRSRPDTNATVFLSHRSVDKDFVRAVNRQLRLRAVATWLDDDRISLGDSITAAISAGIESMRAFVLFWSTRCVGAPWVELEFNAALVRLVQERVPIFVVRIDDTPVPGLVAHLKHIDARNKNSVEIAGEIAGAMSRLSGFDLTGPR